MQLLVTGAILQSLKLARLVRKVNRAWLAVMEHLA
jgi:hypothetical protein